MLGNARNAFVFIPNPFGVKTTEDLVCFLLEQKHEGACNFNDFEDELKSYGIIGKQIGKSLLTNSQRLTKKGHELILNELLDYA